MLQRFGWGRNNPAVEYIYHLKNLIGDGGVAIDIGANLGYYTRELSRLVGSKGVVYGVEPVPPIFEVLNHNTRRMNNVNLLNVALGTENTTITMANNTVASTGYFGTGQNYVQQTEEHDAMEFVAIMQRGSELFSSLQKIDLIKCDIEGYEYVVLGEMRSLIEEHRPIVLLETGDDNRKKMIALFTELNYKPFTLVEGSEVALDESCDNGKDIIFRPQ